MENIEQILEQDEQNQNYYICTNSKCQYRGRILENSIESTHNNCLVVQYQNFVDSINKLILEETFENYKKELQEYLKQIMDLGLYLKSKSDIFYKIKQQLKAFVQQNNLKQLLQQFENNYSQSNFELLQQLFEQSRNQCFNLEQQTMQHKLDKNISKIKNALQDIEKKLKKLTILQINSNKQLEDDQSNDDESSDNNDDENQWIQNQQQGSEQQELENKYNQAFNFLRNHALKQVQQNTEEQQPQLQTQDQIQQCEQQTNIKYIEKFGNNSIVVATESQIRIYDLIQQCFQPKILQINAKITSIQVTKLDSVIVIGKKDGYMEVLEYDQERKNQFNPSIFLVSEEEGRLFIEKLQSSQNDQAIACLGRDGNLKFYETLNFNLINCIKLDYGAKIIPTCLFAKSENEYIIGAEKSVFFNQNRITHVFGGKIKKICQFGDYWLISDKSKIYILKKFRKFLNKQNKIVLEFPFNSQQIIYLNAFYDSQYIFINTKSANSNHYENQIATIQEEKEEINIRFEKLDNDIQVKLLKGYQNNNQTFLYTVDGFNIIEYNMIRDNDKFIIL
ncbi:unnamed protein product [Paramecium pentaurelia]|uniref:WD40-repeat-containing domain n=1 Tax=Paramecium pentaurelia TaxID=43138 RepID=A0A8S1XZU8_9CILI|nr:unnamed protein product [Paramecium pentaurelia]